MNLANVCGKDLLSHLREGGVSVEDAAALKEQHARKLKETRLRDHQWGCDLSMLMKKIRAILMKTMEGKKLAAQAYTFDKLEPKIDQIHIKGSLQDKRPDFQLQPPN